MIKGIVFDIEEFAVFDGPGVRTAVFLKGCPLRCMWCHNPEGLSSCPERVVTKALCVGCGACGAVCLSPGSCTACGACVRVCPHGCLRIAGTKMTAEEVAARVLRHEKLLTMNGGGVTFSGGEPLSQPDFLLAARELMPGLHACLETSGYAPPETFARVARAMDMVLFDIKLVDPALHRRYTGADNTLILDNLRQLKAMAIPFRARVPLIPTVTDTEANLRATAALLRGAKFLEKVELMRYNRAAGAKYAGVGRTYAPDFPQDEETVPRADLFKEANIRCEIL